ncbi:pentatricopeptide repeat-containing protein 2, mitochondrial [Nematolebias whitei]|uniref:pentatricopeptide repeat-containing protein 2, mitochondrial n=1 Tax=Nematolebias whitei TaxID=451745 RepID=UPI001896D29A|nr:pentatricopeptide repeat-containing protein 2, mitochondrial [Nematolebias whitei]
MALLRRVHAKICRSFLSEVSKGVFCGVSQPTGLQGCIGAKRYLLSEDVIKLEDFQQNKLDIARKAAGSERDYIERFKQKLQSNKLILRNELKLFLHLCETSEHMQIAREAIYRYYMENRNMLYGDFRFGPIFMRLCYELGLEGLAAATITDENMKGFFIDVTSFNIAIDMLFIQGSYENAMDVLRSMKHRGIPFNKDTVLLAIGTFYKLNTADSYKNCIDLVEEHQTKGHIISRHACYFAVALALKQNDIEKAKSLYSHILNADHKMSQNFKVIILTMSGEVSEAVSFLSTAMKPESPFVRKPEFSQEVVDLLRLQTKDGPLQMEVEQIITQLEQAGQVTEQTLDDMLCHAPRGKMKPVLMEAKRSTSRRTLKPLQSSLFSE